MNRLKYALRKEEIKVIRNAKSEGDILKCFTRNRQRLIKEFLNSEYNSIELDWKKMGYANYKSIYSSFSVLIESEKYPCHLLTIKGKLYLVRTGKHDCGDIFKAPICDQKIARHRQFVKQTIEDFINSEDRVIIISWKEIGYMTPTSAYNSYKTSLRKYNRHKEVKIQRLGDQIMMVKV